MVQASPESTPEHKMVPASPESTPEQTVMSTPEHEMVPASPESPPGQHMAPELPPEQHMVPASPEWAADQGPWLLMVRIPHVVPDEVFPLGTHLSLLSEHVHAPQASHIAVSRSIAPDPKDIYNHPYVAAFGDFGRFLLYATQGTEPQQEAVDDFDIMPEARLDYTGFPKAFFLCDITTGVANRLPAPERPIIKHGNVGLDTTAFDSMVVEFQPLVGTNRASIQCYSTSSGAWSVHDVLYTPDTTARQAKWRGGDGVVNFGDRMLWVDLAFGMFSLAIPLLRQHRPELQYVPLPEDSQMTTYSSGHAQRRCVGVSQGKVRFLEIDHSICLWTLLDLDTADWFLECEIPVESLWDEDGFRAMGLPEETPAVAFVHPEKYHIIYFILHSVLFSFNIKTGRFLNGNHFEMDNPPADYHSSRFIRPWSLTQDIFQQAQEIFHQAGGDEEDSSDEEEI